jgi:hypothetical protein
VLLVLDCCCSIGIVLPALVQIFLLCHPCHVAFLLLFPRLIHGCCPVIEKFVFHFFGMLHCSGKFFEYCFDLAVWILTSYEEFYSLAVILSQYSCFHLGWDSFDLTALENDFSFLNFLFVVCCNSGILDFRSLSFYDKAFSVAIDKAFSAANRTFSAVCLALWYLTRLALRLSYQNRTVKVENCEFFF